MCETEATGVTRESVSATKAAVDATQHSAIGVVVKSVEEAIGGAEKWVDDFLRTVKKSTDSAIRSARSLRENPTSQFRSIQDFVYKSAEHPAAAAAGIGIGCLLRRKPLFRPLQSFLFQQNRPLTTTRSSSTRARDWDLSTDKAWKNGDCLMKSPEDCEIFIISGNSAAGSAIQYRNCQSQAIFPLEGTVANNRGGEKILQNLVRVLGIREDREDFTRLRYHKIIIVSETGGDGAHQRSLLLKFLFTYQRKLFDANHIYLAVQPRYTVQIGLQLYSFYDNRVILKSLLDRLTQTEVEVVKIQPFEGLGEMMPQQLYETTMDPETRVLKQIYVDDIDEVNQTLLDLMGAGVDFRKELVANLMREGEQDKDMLEEIFPRFVIKPTSLTKLIAKLDESRANIFKDTETSTTEEEEEEDAEEEDSEKNQKTKKAKEGLKFGKLKEAFKEIKWWKETLSATENVDVEISNHLLANTPCVVVTSKFGWSANTERITQSQSLSDANKQAYMRGRRVLEINPRHPIIIELRKRIASDPEDESVKETARLMYQTALIEGKFILDDPKVFAGRIFNSVKSSLKISPDAVADEEVKAEETDTRLRPNQDDLSAGGSKH